MSADDQLAVVSYGGGVQSTALLVLAAQGYIDHRVFLFSNVGDDSEHPRTLEYVRGPAWDYATQHGLELHETHRVPKRGRHKGEQLTLLRQVMAPGSRSIPIPVRMPDTGAPGTRSCTADYKIKVVQEWVKAHGATAANPARVAIGISTDEYQRASSRKREPYEQLEYPLLHLEHRLAGRGGGLDRAACARIIADAGLPVPIKSSCYFCPFHTPATWNDQARDEPELVAKSCELEDTLNARRRELPCPGIGTWPAEATVGLDREEAGEPDADDYQPPAEATYRADWQPLDDQGGCPACRSRQRVELVAGEWRMADHHRGPVYLTRFGKPLRSLFQEHQLALLPPGWDEDEGYRCGDVCDT